MQTFLNQMAELLEEDAVQENDILKNFEAWDSLTQLSIIALAGETYGATISAIDLRNAKTIGDLKKIIDTKSQA